jgi:hypothetical protein
MKTITQGPGRGRKAVEGQEKWRYPKFGELELGQSLFSTENKTVLQNRLWVWALHYDKKRDRKFHFQQVEGGIRVWRTDTFSRVKIREIINKDFQEVA